MRSGSPTNFPIGSCRLVCPQCALSRADEPTNPAGSTKIISGKLRTRATQLHHGMHRTSLNVRRQRTSRPTCLRQPLVGPEIFSPFAGPIEAFLSEDFSGLAELRPSAVVIDQD